jgi:hypothetical protein
LNKLKLKDLSSLDDFVGGQIDLLLVGADEDHHCGLGAQLRIAAVAQNWLVEAHFVFLH